MTEQEIIDILVKSFPFLEGQISSPMKMRVFTGFLTPEQFGEVIQFVRYNLNFTRGHHVIGTDEGDDLGFSYILSGEDNILLVLREKAPKANPEIRSQTKLYPSMLLHELELKDLFGADVKGLSSNRNYPLPDGWPEGQYPMRKEWNPDYFNKDTMRYEPPEAKNDEKV